MRRGRTRTWVAVATCIWASALTASADAGQSKRATVAIDLVGVDPMTVSFRNALRKRVAGDPQLQLTTRINADLRLTSRTKIDWDVLEGRMVLIYIVTSAGRGKSFRISGVCFKNDPAKCARDLIRRSKHVILDL